MNQSPAHWKAGKTIGLAVCIWKIWSGVTCPKQAMHVSTKQRLTIIYIVFTLV